jgi:hypothetical protein
MLLHLNYSHACQYKYTMGAGRETDETVVLVQRTVGHSSRDVTLRFASSLVQLKVHSSKGYM